MFRLLHLSAVLLFLLHKVQFQISVVLLSWLLEKLKSVWLTLSESCSSCEHNSKAGWWGHTGILLGALVGLIKKFMLKCQPGPEPDKGPPQSKDLQFGKTSQFCWVAANWWIIIFCILWKTVLFRGRQQCRSWMEMALWDPCYNRSIWVTFCLNPPRKSFRCRCSWQHAISSWILF